MDLVIIDYGSGNLRSATKALERVKKPTDRVSLTKYPEVVSKADQVILPGVGAFPDCKNGLAAVPGMIDALQEHAVTKGKPFLGICVGMQLMASVGFEHKKTEGLDWFSGCVSKIKPNDNHGLKNYFKIPHMGWNQVTLSCPQHPVLKGIEEDSYFYFVHSFKIELNDSRNVIATTDYGGPITAMVGRDNILGTQFHPEKSQVVGLRMLENFLNWRP